MYDISLFTLNKSNSLKKKKKRFQHYSTSLGKWKNANKYRSQVTLIPFLYTIKPFQTVILTFNHHKISKFPWKNTRKGGVWSLAIIPFPYHSLFSRSFGQKENQRDQDQNVHEHNRWSMSGAARRVKRIKAICESKYKKNRRGQFWTCDAACGPPLRNEPLIIGYI